MRSQIFVLLACSVLVATAEESELGSKFPLAKESLRFIEGFPMLAKFLAIEDPWELPPCDLAARLFPAEIKLAQGSDDYPLLFDGQRSLDWAGLPLWNHVAYETEFYGFDPARPVIRLHVGRPLESGLQLIDYSLSEEAKALFPVLQDSARKEIADNILAVVNALRPYGAKEIPSQHPRIRVYLLPGGTKLTLSDFTGTGRGSVYLQIDLEPASALTSPEHRRLPTFPGAEGYGAVTPGGRGGKVYLVTTLEDFLPERRDGRAESTIGEPMRDGRIPLLPAFPSIPAEQIIPTIRSPISTLNVRQPAALR
jgi:hypothetical protein